MVNFICSMLISINLEATIEIPVWSQLVSLCGREEHGTVVRVIDGDTVIVQTRVGPQTVRLLGIDAPEIRGRCKEESAMAAQASNRLRNLLPPRGKVILVSDVGGWSKDRYKRLLARVLHNGSDVGQRLVREGLAKRWSPPSPRIVWCGGALR